MAPPLAEAKDQVAETMLQLASWGLAGPEPAEGAELNESDEERRVREEELRQIIEASEQARRRLGQRTSASEPTREQLREALYGKRRR